eukprot:476675_1
MTENFTNHPNTWDFYQQYGQSSTQIDNILYMLRRNSPNVTAFNLETLSVIETIPFPGSGKQFRCMAHWNQYLLITGGHNGSRPISEFHIYDITNSDWFTGSAMPDIRQRHTCNVAQQTLYVMGGSTSTGRSDDIISLNLSISFLGEWKIMNGVLHTAKYEHRSVVWQNIIYNTGGNGGDKDIDFLDSITGDAHLDSVMIYTKRMHAAVCVNSTIFVFGGIPTANNQYFQYAVIPTLSPTLSPTIPSLQPTISPTQLTMIPTLSPTRITYSPILPPTERTDSPSLTPTTAIPTKSPTTDPFSIKQYLTLQYILVGSAAILVFLIILIISTYIIVKRSQVNKYKMEMTVNNAMVILLAIGQYDDTINGRDDDLKDAYLQNLDDIDKDISNLSQLFGKNNLNYSIYPQNQKIYWTEEEILKLLNSKAAQLNEGVTKNEFDALVVAISCHGYNNSICTSDYRLISKVAIHRIFSTNYPSSRWIPRIFCFDCCDGADECDVRHASDDEHSISGKGVNPSIVDVMMSSTKEQGKNFEHAKNFVVDDIPRSDVIWSKGEKNPDHKLVVINAANTGFQSKLNTETGSYMLYEFCKKTLEQLNNADAKSRNSGKCIYEIFDEIQQDLEERGKQQIIATYNDKTRYVKFNKNIKKVKCTIELGNIKNNDENERKDIEEIDNQNGN